MKHFYLLSKSKLIYCKTLGHYIKPLFSHAAAYCFCDILTLWSLNIESGPKTPETNIFDGHVFVFLKYV